jgi:maleamate amidohydrolase
MAIWDDIIPSEDQLIYERAGWGKPVGFGQRPAVLIVDVIYNFVGEPEEPILESIERWRYSCGTIGWDGVRALHKLLSRAREKKIPLYYTTWERRDDFLDMGRWNDKNYRVDDGIDAIGHRGNEIVEEIAPGPHDMAFVKKKPSAFFGTSLASYLIDFGVDTLILTGTTTSGCIRSTAIDAFSYNFRTIVPEECVWDRGQLTHKVNLFDIHSKYGDVVKLDEVLLYLDRLPDDIFADRWPRQMKRSK